jgi:hypothetical protein
MTSTSSPADGDVLVAQQSHTVSYDISRVPGPPQFSLPHFDQATRKAIELARTFGVTAWFTADHTHYVRLSLDAVPEGRGAAGGPE